MAEVLICPTGSIEPSVDRALRRAGVIVVQVEHPERCHFIRATSEISADDMVWSALQALNVSEGVGASQQRRQLATNLLAVCEAARAKRPA